MNLSIVPNQTFYQQRTPTSLSDFASSGYYNNGRSSVSFQNVQGLSYSNNNTMIASKTGFMSGLGYTISPMNGSTIMYNNKEPIFLLIGDNNDKKQCPMTIGYLNLLLKRKYNSGMDYLRTASTSFVVEYKNYLDINIDISNLQNDNRIDILLKFLIYGKSQSIKSEDILESYPKGYEQDKLFRKKNLLHKEKIKKRDIFDNDGDNYDNYANRNIDYKPTLLAQGSNNDPEEKDFFEKKLSEINTDIVEYEKIKDIFKERYDYATKMFLFQNIKSDIIKKMSDNYKKIFTDDMGSIRNPFQSKENGLRYLLDGFFDTLFVFGGVINMEYGLTGLNNMETDYHEFHPLGYNPSIMSGQMINVVGKFMAQCINYWGNNIISSTNLYFIITRSCLEKKRNVILKRYEKSDLEGRIRIGLKNFDSFYIQPYYGDDIMQGLMDYSFVNIFGELKLPKYIYVGTYHTPIGHEYPKQKQDFDRAICKPDTNILYSDNVYHYDNTESPIKLSNELNRFFINLK